jgi:hypothetical protein
MLLSEFLRWLNGYGFKRMVLPDGMGEIYERRD